MICTACGTRYKLVKRNKESVKREKEIYADRLNGMAYGDLARKYDCTVRTITRTIARMRHRELKNKKEGK